MALQEQNAASKVKELTKRLELVEKDKKSAEEQLKAEQVCDSCCETWTVADQVSRYFTMMVQSGSHLHFVFRSRWQRCRLSIKRVGKVTKVDQSQTVVRLDGYCMSKSNQ